MDKTKGGKGVCLCRMSRKKGRGGGGALGELLNFFGFLTNCIPPPLKHPLCININPLSASRPIVFDIKRLYKNVFILHLSIQQPGVN